mmetsp:Transcript_33384/g.84336  ORF Transcript_33384/g.84336 Transcript_33384/m.84336 type:complete len:251 (-) Transcript_33384:111-863(-)
METFSPLAIETHPHSSLSALLLDKFLRKVIALPLPPMTPSTLSLLSSKTTAFVRVVMSSSLAILSRNMSIFPMSTSTCGTPGGGRASTKLSSPKHDPAPSLYALPLDPLPSDSSWPCCTKYRLVPTSRFMTTARPARSSCHFRQPRSRTVSSSVRREQSSANLSLGSSKVLLSGCLVPASIGLEEAENDSCCGGPVENRTRDRFGDVVCWERRQERGLRSLRAFPACPADPHSLQCALRTVFCTFIVSLP